ncbi:hypothetical protein [Leuconostoc citreum]
MGLDMYLKAENKQTGESRLLYSWRKANQIRQWFVSHFDQDADAQVRISLNEGTIKALIAEIKIVLQKPDVAPHLMPTSDGFFFGSTDYDDDYFEELKDTLQYLENNFEYDPDNEQLFYTEWW